MTSAPPARSAAAFLIAAAGAVGVFGIAACSDRPEPTAAGVTLPAQTVALPQGSRVVITAPTSAAPTVLVTTGASTTSTPNATATVPGSLATSDASTTTANAAAPAPRAVTTTAAATTTTEPPAACDLLVVEEHIGPAGDGYTWTDLRCAGGWATLVAQATDQTLAADELAVLRSDEGRWAVLDAGGDTSCRSVAVPSEFYTVLDCARWA